jgi:transcription elongation GreA/GreB family factor
MSSKTKETAKRRANRERQYFLDEKIAELSKKMYDQLFDQRNIFIEFVPFNE